MRRWFYNLPLRFKILLVFTLSVWVPIAIISVYDVQRSTQNLQTVIEARQQQFITTRLQALDEWDDSNRAILLFLSETPQVRSYINQVEENGTGNLHALESLLVTFMQQNGDDFVRVCLLTPDGNEATCIEHLNDNVETVPQQQLLNRFDNPYFYETLPLTSISPDLIPVYMSDVEPMEYRTFETEPIVTTHYAKLLQTDDGFIGGVLVLSTARDTVVSLLRDDAINTYAGLLVDHMGDVLLQWGAFEGDNHTQLSDYFPTETNNILRTTNGYAFGTEDTPQFFRAHVRFRPHGQAKIQWTIIYVEPIQTLLASIYQTQRTIIAIALASGLFSWMMVLVLSRGIVRPLSNLTEAAEKIREQDWSVSIPSQQQKDEIGVLASAFVVMSDELQRLINNLNERIEELESANQQIREQNMLFATINSASRTLSQSLDLDDVLREVMLQVRTIVDFDSGNIVMYKENRYQFVSHIGLPDNLDELVDLDTLAIATIKRIESSGREPVIIGDVTESDSWVPVAPFVNQRSWMGVPLVFHDQLLGVINFDKNEPNFYTQNHAIFAMSLAAMAAPAIENASLYAQLKRHAETLEDEVVRRTAELAAEKHQNELILRHVADAILYMDANGKILYANPAWENMTGYVFADVRNKSLGDVSNIHEQVNVADMLMQLSDGHTWSGQFEERQRNGERYQVDLRIVPVFRGGAVFRWVAVFRDVTESHRLQKMKDRLIAHAAHELRTPVTIVLTKLYLMRRQPEKFDYHMKGLEDVAASLKSLVENLLDTSRLERGVIELDKAPTVLQDIIYSVKNIYQDLAAEKDITLQLDIAEDPCVLMLDAERMKQVVTNLIANAIKYTPEGGQVEVKLVRGEDSVTFSVKDDGMGIPKEYLPNLIFEPFVRVNTSNDGGTGLGLAITREIIRLHGGNIAVTSELGEGSTFIVMFPMTEIIRLNIS